MEGNSGNKKDGYESGYESDLENQEGVKKAATNLMRRSSELSVQGQSVIEGLVDANIYQTLSNQHTYDVPRTENSTSRAGTPPSLPSSPPPSTPDSEGEYMYMGRRNSSDRSISLETRNDFQQCSSSGLRRLSSDSISESEMSNAVNQAVEVVSSPEVQEQLKNKIENNPSFVKEQLTKFNKLSNKDKSLFGLGTFGIAIGAPIAIVALPILATIAAVAGLAVAIIGGLKLATPSKAEFKKTGQEIKHGVKNAANALPGKTNLEKLWKSTHKPGVTSENPNLEEFLTKYCFPDQESGKQVKVKFDSDKIEALKATVKTVGFDLDQDIDRMVRKGNSVFSSDYAKDTQFIQTINDVVTKVIAKDHRIEDKFKDKLTEIKQIKATEKTAKQETSFLDKIKDKLSPNRSSSYIKNVEAERRGSSSNQGRST